MMYGSGTRAFVESDAAVGVISSVPIKTMVSRYAAFGPELETPIVIVVLDPLGDSVVGIAEPVKISPLIGAENVNEPLTDPEYFV